jgi:protein TonB
MLEDTMVEQKKFEPRLLEQTMLEPRMFGDSLLETSWAQRSRRGWTTLTSFGVQAIVLGLLLTLSVLKTVGLPTARSLPTPVAWGPPPAARPSMQRQHVTTIIQSNLADDVLIAPPSVPRHVAMLEESTAPPQVSFNSSGPEGGIGTGARDGVWRSLSDSMSRAVAPPVLAPPPTIRTVRRSSMLEGNLIRRVQPVYPPLARAARIQGSVVLVAIISKVGTIENLRVASGHPMLVPAAIDAVSQWRYRPYILNDEAVEVETQITVNFMLGGS